MKTITISSRELQKLRSGYRLEKVEEFKNEIFSKVPKKVKQEVKYRNIKFDYYTSPVEVPPNTIPFGFQANECSRDLQKHLDNYVVFVSWE